MPFGIFLGIIWCKFDPQDTKKAVLLPGNSNLIKYIITFMKAKLLLLITLAVMLCSASNGKKVHTLGDSTMAPYDESATVT